MAKNKKDTSDVFEGIFIGDADKKVTEKQDKKQKEDTVKSNVSSGRPKTNRELKKRVTFTILPSQYDNANKIASIEGKSFSELVSELLDGYLKKNKDKL